MDAMEDLVSYVAAAKYEDLPEDLIESTKRAVLDTVGVLVAGSSAPGCLTLANLFKDWGGKGESTVLVHGGKMPVHHAAMVNSVMARALDFDNGIDPGMHPSASSVPTALAVAEMRGGVGGRDFLAAIALGEDVATRINAASSRHREAGFDCTGVCMVFASAVIAGRLLGLDRQGMLNAVGLAFNQAAGSGQNNVDGALAVRVVQGLTSQSGVLAAIMAKQGITGPRNILQGTYGFFRMFFNNQVDPAVVTEGIGKTFYMRQAIFKKYPSCGGTLAATDGALALARQHDLQPEGIDTITVRVVQRIYELVGQPFSLRSNPEVDAQFSIPYTVANAVLRRSSRLQHFTSDYVRDRAAVGMAQKVTCVVDNEVGRKGIPQSAAIEVAMKNGDRHSTFVHYPGGFPQNPLTDEEFREKFRDCMDFAPRPLASGNTERLVERIANLENCDDVSELVGLLVS